MLQLLLQEAPGAESCALDGLGDGHQTENKYSASSHLSKQNCVNTKCHVSVYWE
jgi:hypothetical protein